jgi:hypothetical protein
VERTGKVGAAVVADVGAGVLAEFLAEGKGLTEVDGALAPVIAKSWERAGRVKTAKRRSAAKGSLEAPKRSRTIHCRSDRRHYLQQLKKPLRACRQQAGATVGRSRLPHAQEDVSLPRRSRPHVSVFAFTLTGTAA